jgi:hypothetical protein
MSLVLIAKNPWIVTSDVNAALISVSVSVRAEDVQLDCTARAQMYIGIHNVAVAVFRFWRRRKRASERESTVNSFA